MSDLPQERYFFKDDRAEIDPISGEKPVKLKYLAGGRWIESKSGTFMPCYNPSTGAVIAHTPLCTADEVEKTIRAAVSAYPEWSDTPVVKRVQVLFRMKALIDSTWTN